MATPRSAFVRSVVCLAAVGLFTASAQARGGRYLIVTANGFANAPALATFVSARTAQGFQVSVYSVPTGTTKETIRTYIESWYDATQPAYVLIVGDSVEGTTLSTATTIPHWIGTVFLHAPTDLPYACMDGSSDWYPDIYLGRFPVDTAADLQAAVAKTLYVEAGVFPDPNYAKRAVFVTHEDPVPLSEAAQDWLIDNYFTPAGFTSTRVYQSQGGTTAQIAAAENAGCLFSSYMGHSSFGGWWGPPFYTSDVQALTNTGRYGLVFAASCGTARFDWAYGECFGEMWLRTPNKGAAAYISSTTEIYSGPASEWESVKRLQKYFYRAFLQNGVWEVGPAWHQALYSLLADPLYGPDHPHTHAYFEEFVLIGDPALMLPHDPGHDNGNLNCDDAIDGRDVSAFVLALVDPAGYAAAYPACHRTLADCNGDGLVDTADIAPFVAKLLSQ